MAGTISALPHIPSLFGRHRARITQVVGGVFRVLVNPVVLRQEISIRMENLEHIAAHITLPALAFNEHHLGNPNRKRRHGTWQ